MKRPLQRSAKSLLSSIYDIDESNYLDRLTIHKDSESLESEIKEIQEELRKMTNHIEEAKTYIDQSKQSQLIQFDQVLKLKEQFIQLSNFISEITSQIDNAKSTYQNSNLSNQDFLKDFELMQEKMTNNTKKLEKVIEEETKLKHINIILKNKLSKYKFQKSQILENYEKYKENKRNLEEENNELKKSCENLFNDTIMKKEQRQDIEDQIKDIDQKIIAIKSTNKNVEEEIDDNLMILNNKRKESESLTAENQKLKKELQEIDENINETIKEQALALERQMKSNQQLNELESKMTNLTSILEAEKEKEQKLTDELLDIQKIYTSKIHETEELRDQIENLSKENESIEKENKEIQQMISDKEIQLGELTQELQNIKSQVNEKKMNCKAIQAQIDNETAKQMKQLSLKKAQLKELKKKKEVLEKQLDDETKIIKGNYIESYKNQKILKLKPKSSQKSRNDDSENNNEEENVFNSNFSSKNTILHQRTTVPTSTSTSTPKFVKKERKFQMTTNIFDDLTTSKKSERSVNQKFVNHRADFFSNFISADQSATEENGDDYYDTESKKQENSRTALADALFDENIFKFNS